MKKVFQNFSKVLAITLCFAGITSCDQDSLQPGLDPGIFKDVPEGFGTTGLANDVVYPPTAKPFGKSYAVWAAEYWKYLLSRPCISNPLNDLTGAEILNGQNGPVIFLASSNVGLVKRQITVTQDKAFLFPILSVIKDYPCPELSAKPATGQSIEQFLAAQAKAKINLTTQLAVTLDGNPLVRLKDFRTTAPMFRFTAQPDLSGCVDACVTGKQQFAVSDGYWIMLKQLSKGIHVLHFQGEITTGGVFVDVTYEITVI